MSRTTAINTIKSVSGINDDVVARLYDVHDVPQPKAVYTGPERRACPRCDTTSIKAEDVLGNMQHHAQYYSKGYAQYIVEDVQLSEYITVQYVYECVGKAPHDDVPDFISNQMHKRHIW